VQEAIVDMVYEKNPYQARLGAEGILLYRSFAEAYVSVANRVLDDVEGNRGKIIAADFSPPDIKTIRAIERCILDEGIEKAFELFLEQSTMTLPDEKAPTDIRRDSIPRSRGWFLRLMKGSEQKKPRNVHFGVGIDSCPLTTEGKAPVPKAFAILLDALYSTDALQVEGIFRVPGSSTDMTRLRDRLNQDNLDLTVIKTFTSHDIAGALKQWLRELPEPVIPFSLYQPVVDAQRNNDRSFFSNFLMKIPTINANVLTQLMQLLFTVTTLSEKNRMTPHNLAVVFSPDLVRKQEEDLATVMRDMPVVIQAITQMIESFESIFEPFSYAYRQRSQAPRR